MWPSSALTSSSPAPTRAWPLLPWLLLLAAGPYARAQTTIDNNFGELYGVGRATENCLNEAGEGCSGSTGPELNRCLCLRDRFALEAATCIARVKPGDLDDVYFQMRANCLETGGYTLVVDQAEWDSAAEAATATSSSSSSSSTPSRTSTTPTATTTADGDSTTSASPTGTGTGPAAATATPSETGATGEAVSGGLDTGGKIGVGVAVGVAAILLTAGVFIWLKWRKRQRKGPRYADRDSQIMDPSDMTGAYPPPPGQGGPGGAGGGVVGAGMYYHKPPVGTASTTTPPFDQQPSPDLRGGGGGGHWLPGAQPYHPHQQYAYPDHPTIAELGDGSDVTSHAVSGGGSARYSELPAGQSPLYPPPSSPSPVSPSPNTPPPLLRPHDGHDPRG